MARSHERLEEDVAQCNGSGGAMVVLQQAAEALAAYDFAIRAAHRVGGIDDLVIPQRTSSARPTQFHSISLPIARRLVFKSTAPAAKGSNSVP